MGKPDFQGRIGRLVLARPFFAMLALVGGAAPLVAQQAPHGPKLVEFNGDRQLTVALVRVGMLRQVLAYTLDVDAQGNPTKCEIKRKFRRKYVEIAVCRPLLKYSRFEPARDASGKAIAGQYSSTITYESLLRSDGSRNSRDN